MLCNLLQSCCHFQLSLNLSSQLHHLPPALCILSPDQLNDGGGEGHANEDVDGAEQHVAGAVMTKVWCKVSKANRGGSFIM